MSAFGAFNELGLGKALFLVGSFVTMVNFTTLIFGIRWPVLRRHGLPFYAFQLLIAIAVTAIVLQASAVIVLLLTDVYLEWAVNILVAAIVFVAAAFIYLDRKNKKGFRLNRLIFKFVMPLSPVAAWYTVAAFGKGAWLLQPMYRVLGYV
jgi:hypothetical protein